MKFEIFRGWDWKKRGMAIAALVLVLAAAGMLVWERREPPEPPPLALMPDEASLAESDVELVATDPATGAASFPYMVPMVQAIDYRLRDVELAGRVSGYRFRHVFQAGCGSARSARWPGALLGGPPACGQSALASAGGSTTAMPASAGSTCAPVSIRDRIGWRLPTVGVPSLSLPPNRPVAQPANDTARRAASGAR